MSVFYHSPSKTPRQKGLLLRGPSRHGGGAEWPAPACLASPLVPRDSLSLVCVMACNGRFHVNAVRTPYTYSIDVVDLGSVQKRSAPTVDIGTLPMVPAMPTSTALPIPPLAFTINNANGEEAPGSPLFGVRLDWGLLSAFPAC